MKKSLYNLCVVVSQLRVCEWNSTSITPLSRSKFHNQRTQVKPKKLVLVKDLHVLGKNLQSSFSHIPIALSHIMVACAVLQTTNIESQKSYQCEKEAEH